MSSKKVIKTKHYTINVDESLNKYDNVVFFPEKLAEANEVLRKTPLAELEKLRKQALKK